MINIYLLIANLLKSSFNHNNHEELDNLDLMVHCLLQSHSTYLSVAQGHL